MPVPGQKRALILHRPHATVDSILRQFAQLRIDAEPYWPDLPQGLVPKDFTVLLFDADMGHDEQFPWPAGEAPIPAIALIGSEAPGRIGWAIRRGADAHLLKPVTSGGIHSALMIAREAFDRRQALRDEIDGLKLRLGQRERIAEATALLMIEGTLDAAAAYRQLRLLAMTERLTIEALAARLVEKNSRRESRHDRA